MEFSVGELLSSGRRNGRSVMRPLLRRGQHCESILVGVNSRRDEIPLLPDIPIQDVLFVFWKGESVGVEPLGKSGGIRGGKNGYLVRANRVDRNHLNALVPALRQSKRRAFGAKIPQGWKPLLSQTAYLV